MGHKVFQRSGILLALLLCLTGCKPEWERYTNQEHKFSILLPASWEKQEGAFKTAVVALAPLKEKPPAFRANVNVIVNELPQKVDLDAIFELNKNELSGKLATMDDLTEGDIYSGMMRGKWMSFVGLLRDFRVKITSAIWIKDKRTYTVTCACRAEDARTYDPMFQKIIRSLRAK